MSDDRNGRASDPATQMSGAMIGPGSLTDCDFGSGASVRVAPDPIQHAPEVLTYYPNSLPMLRVWVTVSNPDDHGPS
jgi:hypothetical protein